MRHSRIDATAGPIDRTRRRQQIRVGCSGWQYKHWRGTFYPYDLPQARWFAHYALTFDTVEINNSFYRLPEASTFVKWREQAPAAFLYAVKASRFLTHMKKLKDPEDPLFRFLDNVRHLGPHQGPLLYQLPPRWPIDVDRFEIFLRTLRHVSDRLHIRRYHVVEFREPTWYDDRIFDLLRRYDVALCLHDMQGSATEKMVVGPFVYVRFHGWTKYAGRYEDERLDEWADWLGERIAEGMDVFAYFNNDVGGHAPRDAVRLRDRIHVRLDATTELAAGRTPRPRRAM
jgi:uncharacterized protein YecE (DUF72 family)